MEDSKLLLEEIDASDLAKRIKRRAENAKNEEELRIGFAIELDDILKKWNIRPFYERKAEGFRAFVSGARKDALYGTVVLEFKSPGKFKSMKEYKKAVEQVKRYIEEEAGEPRYYSRYFGVLTDGFRIGFMRYRKGNWEVTGRLDINSQTIFRLLEAIRGLKRKPLEARYILEVFGPTTDISKRSILTLYNTIVNPHSSRTQMLFEDWKRVFSQVCAYSTEKLKGLTKYYNLEEDIDVEKLMFAIHTYYTILMKLMTSEIVTLFADSLIGSYLQRLEETYLNDKEEMHHLLEEMEMGGIFAELGIKNFLEADYFAWYLDEWNDELADLIYEMSERLLDFEPATVELTPERVEDLFKRLYQNLVPKEIRHKLGEYFTPDWLGELLLEEIGFDGNINKRILDPACGSGTFLVLVIKKMREYAEERFLDKREVLKKILENVRGFDLNPLAVLASKANYIISLADLLRYRSGDIEIPIYLADSIAVSRRTGLSGSEYYIKTAEGEFWVYQEILDKNLLSRILEDIEFCIRNDYSKEIFRKFLENKYDLSPEALDSITRLYWKILSLEKKGRNKIWTRLLKNSFAPLFAGKFDYVIGNPPWINWENLPEFYREQTKRLWEYYGLTKKTKGMGLGKVKRDMAMLFVARSLDRYTKDGGRLAFLIPFTVYKTQAGAGFREFLAKGYWRGKNMNSPSKVLKIHDLVTLHPFEGAVNRTSLVIIEKAGRTEFPVPCVMWYNPRSKGMDQEAELEEVKKITKQFDLVFIPIQKDKPESPWMEITEKAYEGVSKVFGNSPYKAYEGVNTALNQVYWIKVKSEQPSGLLITNPSMPGQKKKVKQVKQIVEKELVYPLIRGREVKKWYVSQDLGYILLPVDKDGRTLSHNNLKVKYPQAWKYFSNFFDDLINRGGEPYKSKLKPYKEKKSEVAEKIAPPFYWLFNAAPALAPYKVVWKHVAGAITGKAEFSAAVAEEVIDIYLGERILIPDKSIMFIPLDSRDEAYYLVGILNSSIVKLYVSISYLESHIHADVASSLRISKFNPENSLHQKLSQLSQKAHEIAKKIYDEHREDLKEDLKKIEEEIDKTVAELYGITDDELKEIRKCLMILKEGEIA